MRRVGIAITALALLAAACGGDVGNAGPITTAPSQQPTTTAATTAPPATTGPTVSTTEAPADPGGDQVDRRFVELFFVRDGFAKSVVRPVATPAVATNAIRALIEGPSPAEEANEFGTAIPADTLLLGLHIDNGLATIDLSREFEVGGGTHNILSRLGQVVYTLTQFPTVDRVLFYLDGEPVKVFSGEGVVLEHPVGRADYMSILPIEPLVDPTASEPWAQEDLPDISGADPNLLSRVALVEDDDVLNVRQDPGVAAPIVGMLLPGLIVERTGQEANVGETKWVEVMTPFGGFWVSEYYLTPYVADDGFADDSAVTALLDEFVALIAADGELADVVSRRGLYVSHHADPIRFTPDDLESILTDPTTYRWPSNAVGSDQIDELPARTFAAAVADSFVSAYEDPDTILTRNLPNAGGNGRLPEHAIPFELQSFNYIGVHDSGDNPDYDGLDWVTWYVSIDYENGRPVIVGLTIDNWAP